jgi:membrane protease YdiL (CAAX protease family)
MMKTKANNPPFLRTSAFWYFLITLGWSWFFWNVSPWGTPGSDPSASLLFLFGGAGPFLMAVVLTHWREDASNQKSFWIRVFDPRRIRGVWWLVSLLLHPSIIALAFAANMILGGSIPETRANTDSITAIFSLVFFTFWFGPLPEEIGWRGFALDRLQNRMSPLNASLILGAVWAIWHVPLFWIPGTFQHEIGFGSLRCWIFLLSMIPLSVLMTWVHNNTSQSTLSAVLIHFSGNLCGAVFSKTDTVAALELVFLILSAAIVTAKRDTPLRFARMRQT